MRGLVERLGSSIWASATLLLACSSAAPPAATSPPAAAAPSVTSPAAVEPSVHSADVDCQKNQALSDELALEGDRSVKLNIDGAIESYKRALEIYPTGYSTLWKLAHACEKKEDWPCEVDAMTRATELAPEYARFWYKLGYALVMLGENGDVGAFERAKAPLKRCIETDANLAECHHFLGEAFEWTDDEQSALIAYSAAIELDPENRRSYTQLADLYMSLGLYERAKGVVKEGMRLVPSSTKNLPTLYSLSVLSASIARVEGDQAEELRALEQAELYADNAHPEATFQLGVAYAVMNPPHRDPAIRHLNQFIKRVCRGSAAARFQEQCEMASTLMQRLGATR
jgi:tetratricopeptide (TPR) repeat protein